MNLVCVITQYGKSKKAGGWDPYGDSFTDKFIGNHDNTLINGISCAVTTATKESLNLENGDWLKITFTNGHYYLRRVDDIAPESNARVDFFNYYAFDEQMNSFGDTATVEKICFTPSSIS